MDKAVSLAHKTNEKTPIGLGYRHCFERLSERISAQLSLFLFGVRDPFCGCKCFHRIVLDNHNLNVIPQYIFSGIIIIIFKMQKNFIESEVEGKKRIGQSKFSRVSIIGNIKIISTFFTLVFQAYFKKLR